MGRPYLEKFKDVQWETDTDVLEKWKKGMTGVPIVDAAMRQATSQGACHHYIYALCHLQCLLCLSGRVDA